ncbi:hypothetical protein F0562_025703 [Nyssa sinensis]|uniref:Uncharacterized protein n=1 Tax=Nyssa sinensis TaxID=561372 RepID=A0A5J5BCS7_9ASTE|nr:hypothetical protein F0562_025703 [Nyssa sinensis]
MEGYALSIRSDQFFHSSEKNRTRKSTTCIEKAKGSRVVVYRSDFERNESKVDRDAAEVFDLVKLLKMAASVSLGLGSLVWAEDSDTTWIDGEDSGV